MSEPILIAIVSGGLLIINSIIVLLLGWVVQRIGKVKKDTTEAVSQLTNNHESNLREELTEGLTAIKDTQEKHGLKLNTHTRQLELLEDGYHSNRGRIKELEDTQPQSRRQLREWEERNVRNTDLRQRDQRRRIAYEPTDEQSRWRD